MKRYLTSIALILLSLVVLLSSCTQGDPLGVVGVKPTTKTGTTQTPDDSITLKPTEPTEKDTIVKSEEPVPDEKPAKPPPKLKVKEADRVAGFVDFSGLWRSSRNWRPETTCKGNLHNRGPHCAANYATHMDWMQLEAVSTNVTETEEGRQIIIVEYIGEYHHGHSFYQKVEKQAYTYNTMARWIDYVYKLKGSATYDLNGGFIRFGLAGRLEGTPLYTHAGKIGVSGEGEGFGIYSSHDMWEPWESVEPAVVPEDGSYKFRFIYMENAEGSQGSSPEKMGSSVDSMYNVNYVDRPVYWRRMVHETNPLNVNGTIAGVVQQKSGAAPQRGTAKLFEEDNEETPIKTASIINGDFSFYNVPVFHKDESGKLQRKKYVVKITHAEADVDKKIYGTNIIYWRPKTVTGVDVPGNLKIKLDAMPEIGIKKNLISILSKLGETNYAAIEKEAEQWIDTLKEGEISDKDLEKIRRGIWAERVVREGAESADASLALFLEMTANLFAELWGDGFSSQSQKLRVSKKFQADRDALLKHKKEHGTESTSKLFKVDPNELDYHTAKLQHRSRTADVADSASFWSLAIKQLRIHLLKAFSAAGMDTKSAEEVSYWCALGMRSLLNYVAAGSTKGGAASLAIKDSINYTVKQLRPILFDNRVELDIPIAGGKFKWDTDLVKVLPSYTSLTKDTLQEAVDDMKGWDKPADFDQYMEDAMATKEILDTLIKDYTNTEQWHHYLKALTDTADVSSDVLGLIGKLGVKQFTVASEIMGKAKYIFNSAAIIVPAKFFFWDAPKLTHAGVYQAYGVKIDDEVFQLPPIHDYVDSILGLPIKNETIARYTPEYPGGYIDGSKTYHLVSTTMMKAVDNSPVLLNSSFMTDAIETYKQSFAKVSELLQSDDIGEAINLSFGDSPETYESVFIEMDNAISLLLDQLSSASSYEGDIDENLSDATVMWIEWKAEEDAWAFRVWEFFNRILMDEFESPSDPYYIVERNRIITLGESLLLRLDDITRSLDNIAQGVAGTYILPIINVRLAVPESKGTGDSIISKSSEEFTIRGYISNLSGIEISNLSTLLVNTSLNPSISVVGEPELKVGTGTLKALDEVRGSGDDEMIVEWTVRYDGNLAEEYVLLSAFVLENGRTPSTFLSSESQQLLLVDPLQNDSDLDGMPDDYEKNNGLDINADDSMDDIDNDGLKNLKEYQIGTMANKSDTDNDGLTDGEELSGGGDGYITDPLTQDTDGDGTPDKSDGSPNNPESIALDEKPEEPVVAVSTKEITLSPKQPMISILISNGGSGTLYWTAGSLNDAIAVTMPEPGNVSTGNVLVISLPPGFIFEFTDTIETVVRVVDAFGADTDWQEIIVKVNPGSS